MTLAWITGAHGFIGRNLSRSLAINNYHVAGLGHGKWNKPEEWGLSYWLNGEISLNNLNLMQQRTGFPDVIFHLAGGSSVGAAITNPREDFTRTVISTAELLEWLKQHSPQTHLLSVSSAAVYGSRYHNSITEDALTSPFSPYGTHKLMMEELCRSYAFNFDIKVVLPRLFSVYGVGLKKQLLWDLCSKIAMDGSAELGGTGEELRDWIDVRDIVKSLEQLSHHASTTAPIVNLASGMATSVHNIATLVAEHWIDSNSSKPLVTFSGQSRPGDPFSLVADITRMNAYGIKNQSNLAQSIAEYVSWFRSNIGVTT